MNTNQMSLIGYLRECARRRESPVNMPDDAQLTPQQARAMLIEKIQAHIASWEGRETDEPLGLGSISPVSEWSSED